MVSDPDALLINPPYAQRYGSGIVPPMGLAYIAAWLRETGARVRIVDLAANFLTHDLPDPIRVAELTEAVLRDIGKYLEGSLLILRRAERLHGIRRFFAHRRHGRTTVPSPNAPP